MEMSSSCKAVMVSLMVVSLLGFGGVANGEEEAQVHHVVGGDRGWASNSDLGSWSSTRVFRVGDNLWFTYSAAGDSVVELKTKEEYESCDTSNPIKMYTDGVNKVGLEGEGIRYFVSGKSDKCKNGLKVDVEVKPKSAPLGQAQALAAGPTTPFPSASPGLTGMYILVSFGLALVGLLGWAF